VRVYGSRIRLSKLYVHDHGNGIILWPHAAEAEVHSSVIANNGWMGPDRGHGHGIYVQNEAPGRKLISDNIVFNNFGWGIHGFADDPIVSRISLKRNVSFNNGAPTGDTNPNLLFGTRKGSAESIELEGNIFFHGSGSGLNVKLGYGAGPNRDLSMKGNTLVGGSPVLEVLNWDNADSTNNLFGTFTEGTTGARRLVRLRTPATTSSGLAGPYRWDGNTYLVDDGGRTVSLENFELNGERGANATVGLTFDEWKNVTALDQTSSFGTTIASQAIVLRDPFEPGRAVVVVINGGGSAVSVSPRSLGLRFGQRFSVRDAQNLPGSPVASGVNFGRPIKLPTQLSTVVPPYGDAPRSVEHTSPRFVAFLVAAS
jgi:hypothetical protein